MNSVLASIVLVGAVSLAAMGSAERAPAGGDAARGKRLFAACTACHAISASAPARIGPHLQGIVGRKAGAAAGFRFSSAMKKSTLTWSEANLDKWLQRPQSVVPGTSMVFAGMAKPADRQDLIAYLKKPAP
jgi:cytochrome c